AFGHQPHDVDLPVGQLPEHGGVLDHGGPGHVFGDEPPGDRGGQQRIAAGDHAHGGDEVLGGGVLEEESAGTGAQGGEDVFVGVEGREHDDPRVVAGHREDRAGGVEAVEARHPNVHEDDVGGGAADEVDDGRSVLGAADDLHVRLRVEQGPEALPDHGL